MLISRFIPVIAPMAMAASLADEKTDAVHRGDHADRHAHLRVLIVGYDHSGRALLFLPVAALGPVAEHLGPLPFGG